MPPERRPAVRGRAVGAPPRASGIAVPLARAAFGLFALGLAGCAEELGPEAMPTARVAGRVHVGTRPVGGGWIEFLPIDGTVGLLESARLGPDGSFAAERAPVGRVAIRVVHPPIPLPCGRIFERAYLIRRTIAPALGSPMDIDLIVEAVRHCPDRPPPS